MNIEPCASCDERKDSRDHHDGKEDNKIAIVDCKEDRQILQELKKSSCP